MFSRRKFLSCSALAVAARSLRAQPAASSASPTDAHVQQGTLRGESTAGVRIFRGVPFAQPPVGPLRFRAPEPPLAFAGVRAATQFAPASLQPNEPKLRQSEDCLYLNISAPDIKASEQPGSLPVLVWVHGGGFTGGSSFAPLFDGSEFARAGIVCVTVAYRLGALGFLDVSPFLGPAYAGSADNALRDLIASLQWVSTNIHAFGGDPHRVTVGGESAGAKLADMLMGIPAAEPLFQQVISESGGAERIWPLAQAVEVGRGFGKQWTEQTQTPTNALLTAPGSQIVDVQAGFMRSWPAHFPLRAELDQRSIPTAPITAIRSGATRGKRLLLGTNRDESALFLGPHPKQAPGAQDLGNMPLTSFDQVTARYETLYPDMPEDLRRIRSVTAEEYWIPSLRVAEAHIAGGGDAWVYRLDFPGEGRFAGLAFHSYDLRFVWDFSADLPTPAARTLAATMHGAWVTFIKGDTPAAPGLPPWTRYTLAQRPTMLLDTTCQIALDPAGAERRLWDNFLKQ